MRKHSDDFVLSCLLNQRVEENDLLIVAKSVHVCVGMCAAAAAVNLVQPFERVGNLWEGRQSFDRRPEISLWELLHSVETRLDQNRIQELHHKLNDH